MYGAQADCYNIKIVCRVTSSVIIRGTSSIASAIIHKSCTCVILEDMTFVYCSFDPELLADDAVVITDIICRKSREKHRPSLVHADLAPVKAILNGVTYSR